MEMQLVLWLTLSASFFIIQCKMKVSFHNISHNRFIIPHSLHIHPTRFEYRNFFAIFLYIKMQGQNIKMTTMISSHIPSHFTIHNNRTYYIRYLVTSAVVKNCKLAWQVLHVWCAYDS
jgi:hypothetical protein